MQQLNRIIIMYFCGVILNILLGTIITFILESLWFISIETVKLFKQKCLKSIRLRKMLRSKAFLDENLKEIRAVILKFKREIYMFYWKRFAHEKWFAKMFIFKEKRIISAFKSSIEKKNQRQVSSVCVNICFKNKKMFRVTSCFVYLIVFMDKWII